MPFLNYELLCLRFIRIFFVLPISIITQIIRIRNSLPVSFPLCFFFLQEFLRAFLCSRWTTPWPSVSKWCVHTIHLPRRPAVPAPLACKMLTPGGAMTVTQPAARQVAVIDLCIYLTLCAPNIHQPMQLHH